MPYECQVGIDFHGALQLGQRFGIAAQLGQRRAAQRICEAGITECGARPVGELQRLRTAAAHAEQLEVLGPGGFELGLGRQELVIRRLRVPDATFPREPTRAREGAFAACIGKQIVRRGGPHGAQIYPPTTRWLAARGLPTFLPP